MGTDKTKERSTILIVDDSEMNREMLSEILRDDYNTIEAADGAEAVAVLKEHEHDIDLVLLDIVMPGMDGFEVLSIMNRYNWIELYPAPLPELSNSPKDRQHSYALQQAEKTAEHR